MPHVFRQKNLVGKCCFLKEVIILQEDVKYDDDDDDDEDEEDGDGDVFSPQTVIVCL